MVGHFFVGLRNFAIDWWPLFLIIFYALMLYLFWRVLALMPRVKPAKIETGSSSARFDEVAGLDEAKAELLEIVEFL
jgi:ATP-dependent Zn protease